MDFITNYSMFFAKTATVAVAILVIIAFSVAISTKNKQKEKGKLTVKKINDKLDEMAETVNAKIQTKAQAKAQKKKQKEKKQPKKGKKEEKRIFVIRFNGDIRASAVEALRQEITAILLTAQPEDRVLCCLESPGGMVNAYGLAASQLHRLKEAGIHLTISVDKVAASGGYMMACVADKIIAAPFSIIGSIGVVAQLPNFHRYLEKKNIDFEMITAGEYKRTLTVFGKNTDKGREKMQSDINDTHQLFKSFIIQNRSQVDIDQVATGEHWYGQRALELNLVDEIKTSDDYILAAKNEFAIYQVCYQVKKPIGKRISESAQLFLSKWTSAEY